MATVAIGEKPNAIHKGTQIAAKIGIVENDEPIPMVTNKPISSIISAARPLLSPIISVDACTSAGTSPVALITAEKPIAVIT